MDEAEALEGRGATVVEEAEAFGAVEEPMLEGATIDELTGGAAEELGGGAITEMKVEGATVEGTGGGATHRVQIVEMLVTLIVETPRLV